MKIRRPQHDAARRLREEQEKAEAEERTLKALDGINDVLDKLLPQGLPPASDSVSVDLNRSKGTIIIGPPKSGLPLKRAPKADRELVLGLTEITSGLTSWELDFVEDVARRVLDSGRPLTPGQRSKAAQILTERG